MTGEEKISRLTEATKSGEVLTIVYHAGSQPDTKRTISLMKIQRDDIVLAKDGDTIAKVLLLGFCTRQFFKESPIMPEASDE